MDRNEGDDPILQFKSWKSLFEHATEEEFVVAENETERLQNRKHGKEHNINDTTSEDQFVATLHKDIENFLTLDEFKDFTIIVDSKEFKVHKLIFMARSPYFAEFIRKNPGEDKLVLTDIQVEIFESILNFVYTDQPPTNAKHARDIFIAAGTLKIESLVKFSAKILIKRMKGEENLKALLENFNLGVNLNYEKLKLMAFEEIKKHFEGRMLRNDLMDDPEKLKKLIEAKELLEDCMVKEDVGSSVK